VITSTFLTLSLIVTYSLINLFCHKIVVHGFVFRRWLTTYYKVNASKVNVIPHGVMSQSFSLEQKGSQHRHLMTGDKRVILYFGVLSPRNSQMLAQAMMTLIEDEDLAAKFTKNLKEKAKKLSWEKWQE